MPRPPLARFLLTMLALTLALPTLGGHALAQETPAADEPKPADQPLVVINVAGLQRVLDDFNYTFASAERDDISEALAGLLGFAGDLRGIDRTRPFGVMLFMQGGLTQPPTPVGYLPVTKMDDLIETIALGPVTIDEVAGAEGRYTLEGPGPTLHVALENDYAFVARDEASLDLKFPDPAKAAQTLSSRYDLSVFVNLNAIPESTKNLFLDFLRASTEAELQQRDGEPDGAYQVRRAQGMANLEFLEGMLSEGQDLTIGLDTSKENRRVAFELTLNARPDSKFAKKLRDVAGRPSHFAPLLDETVPMSLSVSWLVDEAGRKVMKQAVDSGETSLTKQLAAEGETEVAPVRQVFDSLRATVEKGHADLFMQFLGQPPGKFVLIGGARVRDGASLADGLVGVAQRLQDQGELEKLEINTDSHQGITFHRIAMDSPGRDERRLYGEDPAVHVGIGSDVVWFSVGGGDSLPALKSAMDKLAESTNEPRPQEVVSPFRLIANASSWVALSDDENDRPRPGRDLARQAFAKGDDQLRVEVRPTETGMRLRVTLDEGFIRWLGLGVGRQYDRSRL